MKGFCSPRSGFYRLRLIIHGMNTLPRLVSTHFPTTAADRRMGQLVNQTKLGRDVALPQPTVHRWLNLLETSYLLIRLPAYAVNHREVVVRPHNSPIKPSNFFLCAFPKAENLTMTAASSASWQ